MYEPTKHPASRAIERKDNDHAVIPFEAHVKLCVLALQIQRCAEIRTGLSWARIAHALTALKAVRYQSESRTIVQRTKIGSELAGLLKRLGISAPKQLMAVTEAAKPPAPA
jgi:hypothetical protein